MLSISSSLLRQICDHAASDPRREVCGLLFGAPDHVTAATACRNVADRPADSFEIDPVTLLAAHRAARAGGAAIIGWYHSHPGGLPTPSPRDAAAAAPDGRLWLIVGAGRIGVYRAVADGPIHGRFEPVAHRRTDVV